MDKETDTDHPFTVSLPYQEKALTHDQYQDLYIHVSLRSQRWEIVFGVSVKSIVRIELQK